jgi:exodeoxyribonuclease III
VKIVTWNCARGFAEKSQHIFFGSPDIAVIQECSKKSTENSAIEGYVGHWVGEKDNLNIGLGVFHTAGWRLRQRAELRESDPKWIVPFEVNGPVDFTLIAVWACAVKGSARASYVGQIHRALEERPEWFSQGPIVMAGDFNSNAIFDKNRRERNHSSMVEKLGELGMVSAYHSHDGTEHGSEETPTFHLYRRAERPFHLDYVFLPVGWRDGMKVEIGSHKVWASRSDHCPITVEFSHPARC